MWTHASAAAASRICAFSHRAEATPFTPWSAALPVAPDEAEDDFEEPAAVIDPAQIEAEAFTQGFEEGRRVAALEMAGERAELARLVEALGVLQPEEPHALGELLAETVDRLVRQIVGEVSIDGTILADRAHAAAALIAEESAPSRMRLHPDDHARLGNARIGVEMIADPALAPGTVLLESGEGWIEDGPDVGLEKLRAALDRLGLPR
ncbi:hypothetical protein FOY91_12830 [Sphingomonas solaris]|uniref:Flagellar assembly protein FliH/Type III secretion system HrpE domain-containing protein n=1 Tax=Alterirhizorhabdus solaris TaxID=2529389 RepID=A0A558R1H2_9SPHN|nr:hypothetical protein FOY91_12830 [Sphingomonas solaris]